MSARASSSLRRDGRRSCAGFTLIEILCALGIFLAGVAGVYALLSTALAMQQQGLDLARTTRDAEGLVHRLRQEIALGRHVDPATGVWTDVKLARDEDGTFYSVVFVPETGNEAEGTLLVILRMARRERDLAGARPVSYVLTPGRTFAGAVQAARASVPP